MHTHDSHNKASIGLVVGALGVVFGDIGTSPLYAVNEIFFGHGQLFPTAANILGIFSLVFWTITFMVGIKYVIYVLKSDNDGEGGVFALYSRLHKHAKKGVVGLVILLILAAGLLIGEGIITPAISVISAVEGLAVLAPEYKPYVIPFTILILTFLFSIQHKGSSILGKAFGPIALVWFLFIGILGARQIWINPSILKALNPYWGLLFFWTVSPLKGLLVLSSVMLVITGAESIFADMGHFGKRSIRIGWFALAFPCLVLNYFGQGAYLLGGGTPVGGTVFFNLIPAPFLGFGVVIATLAAIVASQGLISGTFSLVSQAIALGVFPRLKITHTHHAHAGQIFIFSVNWFLYVGSVFLVLYFQNSTALASLYGVSLSFVMVATSLAMVVISQIHWKWTKTQAVLFFGSFALMDLVFALSNLVKLRDGGFISLIIGLVAFMIMRSWRWGRKTAGDAYSRQQTITMGELVKMRKNATQLLDRNVVLMVPKPLKSMDDNTPALLQFFLDRVGVLPKNLLLVEVIHKKVPWIHGKRHESVVFYRDDDKGSVISVTLFFGFMEDPNVEQALENMVKHHEINLPRDPSKWVVHISYENITVTGRVPWVKRMRLGLYLMLRQAALPAYFYYGLGKDVNLSIEVMPIKIG